MSAAGASVPPIVTSATILISSDTDDADQDSIADNIEQATDFDGDNIPNFHDPDSDGDGRPDRDEGTLDLDTDEQMDFLDAENPTPIEETPIEETRNRRLERVRCICRW